MNEQPNTVAGQTTSGQAAPGATPAPLVQPPAAAVVWLVRLLALGALAISVYLTVQSWRGGALAGCDPGSGCDRVLTSRWSKWAGVVPVSLPACLVYVGFLLASAHVRKPPTARSAWRAMAALGVTALAAAAWFMLLQWRVIGAFCPYCTAAHALGAAMAIVTLLAAPRPLAAMVRPVAPMALTVAVLLAALVVGQTALAPRTHRVVTFHGITIQADAYPIVGPPDAPHVFVHLFDYTCPNCRLLHQFLKQAQARYPGRFAVALGLVPLDAQCNPKYLETEPEHANACEYARLTLAVWNARREAMEEFDEYLMTGDKAPPIAEARQKAAALVGDARLTEALRQEWADQFIKMQIQLNDLLRRRAREMGVEVGGGVPTLVMGSGVFIAGRPERAEQLFEAIEQALAAPQPAATQP